jgi:hypothetical protein
MSGDQANNQAWSLQPAQSVVIGRYRDTPDIDLGADRFVSRAHARIWHADDRWWIEDLHSSHGTLVRGRDIRGAVEPTQLTGGDEILIGGTRLIFAAAELRSVRSGQLSIELELAPAVNFSLVHCGLPIVSQVIVRSTSNAPTAQAQLGLSLAPYAEASPLSVQPLEPGASATFVRPAFTLDYTALQAQTERARWPLHARVDGQLAEGDALECWVLAHNEWSAAEEHRLSLAAFVLPNHPLVAQLVTEVVPDTATAPSPNPGPDSILAALHEHLSARWRLGYRLEPPHWSSNSQKIRLPHQVLVDPITRVGQGTCVDLALLFGGCLESVGLQPLLAIIDMGEWWHALVGAWRVPTAGVEPLVFDRQRLLEEASWIDPTACTQDADLRRDLAGARAEAAQILSERPLRFALDVAAARMEHITPLPFAGEPFPSPAVLGAFDAARAAAEAAGSHAGGAALLLGLLRVEGGFTRQLIATRLGSIEATTRRLSTVLLPDADGAPQRSFRRTRDFAQSLAREQGSPMVLEPHLLAALLHTPSTSLDAGLETLGITRADLLSGLRGSRQSPTSGGRSSHYSVFSEWRADVRWR